MCPRIALLLAAVLTIGPGLAFAAGGEGQGAVSRVLFALGVLLLAANLGGLAAERLGQPPVLGELVIGITLASLVVLLRGAEAVAYVQSEPTLQILAEVGVLILLFDVGLETDIRALVRVGPSALLVALIGVAAPLALGWGVAAWLLRGGCGTPGAATGTGSLEQAHGNLAKFKRSMRGTQVAASATTRGCLVREGETFRDS